jgi:hypothetical protein
LGSIDGLRRELLFGIGDVCVVHPAAPVFGQHTSSSQQARQHPETNCRPEDKNANASDAQYSKHNDKVSVHSYSVGGNYSGVPHNLSPSRVSFRFSDWQLPFLQFVGADLPGRFCTAIANVLSITFD